MNDRGLVGKRLQEMLFLNISSINSTSSESLASVFRAIVIGPATASTIWPRMSIRVVSFILHLCLLCFPSDTCQSN